MFKENQLNARVLNAKASKSFNHSVTIGDNFFSVRQLLFTWNLLENKTFLALLPLPARNQSLE